MKILSLILNLMFFFSSLKAEYNETVLYNFDFNKKIEDLSKMTNAQVIYGGIGSKGLSVIPEIGLVSNGGVIEDEKSRIYSNSLSPDFSLKGGKYEGYRIRARSSPSSLEDSGIVFGFIGKHPEQSELEFMPWTYIKKVHDKISVYLSCGYIPEIPDSAGNKGVTHSSILEGINTIDHPILVELSLFPQTKQVVLKVEDQIIYEGEIKLTGLSKEMKNGFGESKVLRSFIRLVNQIPFDGEGSTPGYIRHLEIVGLTQN